jgi:hypothetical protein
MAELVDSAAHRYLLRRHSTEFQRRLWLGVAGDKRAMHPPRVLT